MWVWFDWAKTRAGHIVISMVSSAIVTEVRFVPHCRNMQRRNAYRN